MAYLVSPEDGSDDGVTAARGAAVSPEEPAVVNTVYAPCAFINKDGSKGFGKVPPADARLIAFDALVSDTTGELLIGD